MKKILIAKIMLLVIAVSLAGLSGCDEEKKDYYGILMALLGSGNQDLTVINISPVNGTTGLPTNVPIIITFNRPTDGTFGTVAIYNTFQTPLTYVNASNCTMTFNLDKSVLTIDGGDDFYSGMLYQHIIVSGFRDADGNLMQVYDVLSYNFRTWTIASGVAWPTDGAIDVDLSATIQIHFHGFLGADKGTVSLNYNSPDYGTGTFTYADPGNCTISFSSGPLGSIVTVTPTNPFYDDTIYSNISVSGFKDPYGNAVMGYTSAGYDFTTVDIN